MSPSFQAEAQALTEIPESETLDIQNVRPFKMHAITVNGKYLNHERIVAVAQYFLEQRRLYLKECSRVNMVQLAALGHQFTPDEWKNALDIQSLPETCNQQTPDTLTK